MNLYINQNSCWSLKFNHYNHKFSDVINVVRREENKAWKRKLCGYIGEKLCLKKTYNV